MNALELKSDLHQLVDKVNDINLLNAVKVILSKEADWADNLSESLKAELKASIKEADTEKIISHEDAMAQIKRRYNF